MRYSRLLRIIAAAAALSLVVGPSASAIANTGWPPPVRTASGTPIVRDWLAEHRRYADWHLTLVDPLYRVP